MGMDPSKALKRFEPLIAELTSKVNKAYKEDAKQELRLYVLITIQKANGNIKEEYLEKNLKAILCEFIKKEVNKGVKFVPESLTKSQLEDSIAFNHYELNKLDNIDRNIQVQCDKRYQRKHTARKCQNNLTKG